MSNYLWQRHRLLEEILSDNPFFQRKTTKTHGCQIDYLMQTKFNNLFICEIKFSKKTIGLEVIKEMQSKLSVFSTPKGFSRLPILIHVNGIQEEVIESMFFAQIIDFCEFLEGGRV
jgi:hypothetical protein